MNESELSRCLRSIVSPRELETPLPVGEALRLLDEFVRSGVAIDGQLRHYLERRSYAKALAFLGDSSLPHRV